VIIWNLVAENVDEFDARRFQERQVINVLAFHDLQLRNHELLKVSLELFRANEQVSSSMLVGIATNARGDEQIEHGCLLLPIFAFVLLVLAVQV
jgi:hypothetical protein